MYCDCSQRFSYSVKPRSGSMSIPSSAAALLDLALMMRSNPGPASAPPARPIGSMRVPPLCLGTSGIGNIGGAISHSQAIAAIQSEVHVYQHLCTVCVQPNTIPATISHSTCCPMVARRTSGSHVSHGAHHVSVRSTVFSNLMSKLRWPCSFRRRGQVTAAAAEHRQAYIETSPAYGLGLSERRVGLALSHQDRDATILQTKVRGQSSETRPHRPTENRM